MTVAVVIRCRNEESHIARLLTGITQQRLAPDEVVVIDSGSTDATVSIASQFATKICHLRPEEFSFGRACNLGCAESDADMVVFVSAHCYPVYDSWLEALVAPFDDENVAMSYGRQVAPPDGRYAESRLFARWYPEQSVARQRDPFCNNANSAIRRNVWLESQFDEDLTGLEDLDWSKRALERGLDIAYVAEAPVVHVHAESFGQVINRYRREAIAHREIYDDQSMGLSGALRLLLANIFSDYVSAYRDGALSREEAVDISRFRVAQFYGTYRGFAQQGPVTSALKRRFYYPDRLRSTPKTRPDSAGDATGRPIDYEQPSQFVNANEPSS